MLVFVITNVITKVLFMSVRTKDKLVQMRVEQELFDRFAAYCDVKRITVSHALRWYMGEIVSRHEKKLASDAEWTATLESRRKAVSVSTVSVKAPVEPSRKPEGPVAARMRKKKEEKMRRKVVEDDDDGDEE